MFKLKLRVAKCNEAMLEENMKALIYVVLFVVVIFLDAMCGVCASKEATINAVEKQGYSNVQVLDKHIFFTGWRGCSSADAAVFEIRATNARGQDVDILACAGWPFKGVTVRTE